MPLSSDKVNGMLNMHHLNLLAIETGLGVEVGVALRTVQYDLVAAAHLSSIYKGSHNPASTTILL